MDSNATTNDRRTAILREQYRMVANQVPLLYVIVLLSTFSVCTVSYPFVVNKSVFIAPTIIGALCAARFFYWCGARKRVDTVCPDRMRKDLRATKFLGPFFATTLSIAALTTISSLDPYPQAFVLGLVWVATISSAFALFALPFAAYTVLIGSGLPMVLTFLATGKMFLVLVAIVNSGVGALLIITLRTNYGAFSEIIDSRARIIEERRQAEAARKEAARLADSDFLTDLANRRHFMRELAAHHAEGNRKPYMLALIDLDSFKPVNDTYGHPVGDEVLREVGRRLAKLVEGRGIAARFGGDEFGIIVDQLPDDQFIRPFANELIQCLNAPYQVSVGALNVGASCGIALHRHAPESDEKLLECADVALYRSKSRGDRSVVIHHPEMCQTAIKAA